MKDRKLVFLIRHGEAVSNAVQSYVGLETWQSVTTQCSWKNSSSGEELQLYDPPLTEKGQLQVISAATESLRTAQAVCNLGKRREGREQQSS